MILIEYVHAPFKRLDYFKNVIIHEIEEYQDRVRIHVSLTKKEQVFFHLWN